MLNCYRILNRKKDKLLFFIIITFGVFVKALNLFTPLTGLHDFRQTQTASNVWLYHKLGFSFPKYHVPMFGGKYWVLEFPTYQLIVYTLTRIFGLHDYVGRLVSITCSIITSILLFYIAQEIFNVSRKYSFLTIFIYNLIPINLYFFGAYIIDPLVLTLSLLTLIIGYENSINFDYKKSGLFLSLLIITILTKLTTVMTIILPLIFFYVRNYQKKINRQKISLFLFFGLCITMIFFISWYFYRQFLNAQSYTLKDGTLKDWYLGTNYFYFDYYKTLLYRLLNEITPLGLFFLILGIYKIFKNKSFSSKFLILWLISGVLYVVVFNNLNFIHNYYQLPLYPLISLIIVFGWIFIFNKFRNWKLFKFLEFVVFYLISLSSIFTYLTPSFWTIKTYQINNQYTEMVFHISNIVNRCINDNEKVVYIWPDADPNHPTILYYSKRIGYNFDLLKISAINELLIYDKQIKNLVLFPIMENRKKDLIEYLTNLGLDISELCYEDKILIVHIK